MQLVFVRHGKTRGNEAMEKARDGTLDYPEEVMDEILNSHSMDERLVHDGFVQLANTRNWLEANTTLLYDHYFCSPFPRAIESAIALDLPLANWKLERDLRERDHGLFDRLTPDRIAEVYPEYSKRKDQASWLTSPPGGESLAMLSLRIRLWLLGLKDLTGRDDWTIAISHYDTLSVVLMWLTNMSISEYHKSRMSRDGRLTIPNGSVIELTDMDPNESGKVTKNGEFGWFRLVDPSDPESVAKCRWQEIKYDKTYCNDELRQYLLEYHPL